MSLKARITVAFVCLGIVLFLNIKFVLRQDPDAVESMYILTNFVMKQNFTDAARLRMDTRPLSKRTVDITTKAENH